MTAVQILEIADNKEVMHTYPLPLHFENNAQRKIANQRVKALEERQNDLIYEVIAQQTALKLARTYPDEKFPVHKIKKITRKSPNIAESAYHWLFVAAKGAVNRENRIYEILNFFKKNPQQALEWVIFGRSPYTESVFSQKWKVSRVYLINLLTSFRRQVNRYWHMNWQKEHKEKKLEFNNCLPQVTQKEVEQAIKDCYNIKLEEFSRFESITSQQKSFLTKLHLISLNEKEVAPYITSWINISQTSRWRSLKNLSKIINERIEKDKRRLFSTLRLIVVFALFQHLWETVFHFIKSTQPEDVLNSPFKKKKKGRLPIKLPMGERYVIIRPGNSDRMTELALQDGFFHLCFPLKGKRKIIGKLLFPDKIVEFIKKGARIRILQICSGEAPSYKPEVSVIVAGLQEMFLSTKLAGNLLDTISSPPNSIIGIDVNRIGKHMFSFSTKTKLPKQLLSLSASFIKLSKKEIPQMCKNLDRKRKQKDSLGYVKAKGELSRLYNKRSRILKEIKGFATHFIAAVIVKSRCKTVCIENLTFNPKGVRGALAKAIYSMPDDLYIFKKAVQLASIILGYRVNLVKINPRYTSKHHFKCKGVLQRENGSFDYARCNICGENINVHLNAALNIAEKGKALYYNHLPLLDAAEGFDSNESSS